MVLLNMGNENKPRVDKQETEVSCPKETSQAFSKLADLGHFSDLHYTN